MIASSMRTSTVVASRTSSGSRRDMLRERADRLGRRIADGHQPVVGQDEPDRGRRRVAVDDAEKHADRHVERAIALIEAARRLDLGHFVLGRHVEVDAALDQRFFLLGRLLEVDPGRAVGNLLERRFDNASVASGAVGPQHGAHLSLRRSDAILATALRSAAWLAMTPCRGARASAPSPSSSSPQRCCWRWAATRSAPAGRRPLGRRARQPEDQPDAGRLVQPQPHRPRAVVLCGAVAGRAPLAGDWRFLTALISRRPGK